MQFKDNTLYSAIKPTVLRNECNILRSLKGECHCLKLFGIYESPSTIYILTEYMSGGDMYEYLSQCYGATIVNLDLDEKDGKKDDDDYPAVANRKEDGAGLRTEDVSRMSFQLLDAVSHCAKHGVIHRDIKVSLQSTLSEVPTVLQVPTINDSTDFYFHHLYSFIDFTFNIYMYNKKINSQKISCF